MYSGHLFLWLQCLKEIVQLTPNNWGFFLLMRYFSPFLNRSCQYHNLYIWHYSVVRLRLFSFCFVLFLSLIQWPWVTQTFRVRFSVSLQTKVSDHSNLVFSFNLVYLIVLHLPQKSIKKLIIAHSILLHCSDRLGYPFLVRQFIFLFKSAPLTTHPGLPKIPLFWERDKTFSTNYIVRWWPIFFVLAWTKRQVVK